MKTETPRTDEEWAAWPYAGPGISVHFGRELERELTAARAEIKDLHKAYGFELRDPNGTIWDYAAKMKEEITAARAELNAVTEQRDRLAEAVNAATILIAAKGRHNTMLAYNGLRDALQSLTTNEKSPDAGEKGKANE
jgi:hypothetical protein